MENSTKIVSNIWCGFAVSEPQKEVLTELSLSQFKLPVKDRLSTKSLLKLIGIKIKVKE